MKTIVHISADFPDAMRPEKTRVVQRLVERTDGFRHRVYSLNRINGLRGMAALPFGEDRLAIAYAAPPKGLFLARFLETVGRFVVADLAAAGIVPDLIHVHKLTMEGLTLAPLREAFPTVPYVVTVQGDTDLKIAGVRRDLVPRFATVAREAAAVLTLAPWSRVAIARVLGIDPGAISVLPCLLGDDGQSPALPCGEPRLAAVFNLVSARRKNLPGLARAAVIAARAVPTLAIDVIGGGAPADVIAAEAMIREAGATGIVRLAGPASGMGAVLKGYAGMAVPTLRESYGLVHVEALLAGIPILWSRDRGVDGLFPAEIAGWRCDPDDDADIARGLVHLVENEAGLKAGIAAAQAEGAFEALRTPAIVGAYRRALTCVLGS